MKSVIISILAAASAVVAHPPANKRTPGDVKICAGTQLQEPCTELSISITGGWAASCTKLEAPYAGSVGSVSMDTGALCRLFDANHPSCSGSGLAFLEAPGVDDLFEGNPYDAGHDAQYISCVRCDACTGEEE